MFSARRPKHGLLILGLGFGSFLPLGGCGGGSPTSVPPLTAEAKAEEDAQRKKIEEHFKEAVKQTAQNQPKNQPARTPAEALRGTRKSKN